MNVHHFSKILFALILLLTGWTASLSAEEPLVRAHVQDAAELLSPKTRTMLEHLLSDFEQDTTHQIFVATFKTYGDEKMETFTSTLAEEWKIGYKDVGNGAILAIFKNEHQVWIEVGAGLSERLPYLFRKALTEQKIAPLFRNQEFDRGTLQAVREMIWKIYPEFPVDNYIRSQTQKIISWVYAAIAFLILFSLLIDLVSYLHFCRQIEAHPHSIYQIRIGRYSFLEWWLIYGLPVVLFEILYYQLLVVWLNPTWSITAKGGRKIFWSGKTGRGNFLGNGTRGKW